MTRIKICGITNIADALAAVDAGANFLGFIAVPGSPRHVSIATVDAVSREVPPYIETVIVAQTLREGQNYRTSRIQYYDEGGVKPPDRAASRRIRVFRIKNAESVRAIRTYPHFAGAYLLDTHHETLLGGVGVPFDWEIAREAVRVAGGIPVFLAGGLTPRNVGDAILAARPWAVDVSSGVEVSPGKKDPVKMADFVAAVRFADKEIADETVL